MSGLVVVQEPHHHLTEKVTFQTQIIKTIGEKDPFFSILYDVKKSSPDDSLIKELAFPEYFLNLSCLFDYYVSKNLTIKDPLFSRLNDIIKKLHKFSVDYSDSIRTKLETIKEFYQNYRKNLCKAEGKDRKKIMKGPCRIYGILHGKLECRTFTQKQGKCFACLGKYGEPLRSNQYGANAVRKEGNVFYKRSITNPLKPGIEYATDSLNRLIAMGGSPPTEILKIANLVILDPFSFSEGTELRSRVIFQQAEGRSLQEIFQDVHIKNHYPFEQKRAAYILQASNAVDGVNLYEFLQKPKPFDSYGYTSMFFLALLSCPCDGRADNYMVTCDSHEAYHIIGIDNDEAFVLPFRRTKNQNTFLQLKTILFLLPEMQCCVDEKFATFFLEIDPAIILIDWLSSLTRRNADYEELLKTQVLSSLDYEELSLPISISFSTLAYMYRMMKKLQAFLQENVYISHWQVLDHVLPVVSHIYQNLLMHFKNDPLEAQQELFAMQGILLEDSFSGEQIQQIPDYLFSQSEMTVSDALQEFILFVLPTLDPTSQRTFLEKIFLIFPEISRLILKYLDLDDTTFLQLIYSCRRLQKLTLDWCHQISKAGILRLLSDFVELNVTLGLCDKVSSEDLKEIIDFAWENNREFFVLIAEKPYVVEKEKIYELFSLSLDSSSFLLAKSFILLGVDPNFLLDNQETYLHRLAEKNAITALNFLLREGAKINVQDKKKLTPLHRAALLGNVEAVSLLIKEGISIDAQDIEGKTALHLAVLQGHVDVISVLIEQGANPDIVTFNKETLLHLAAAQGCLPVLEKLLQYPFCRSFLEAKDFQGETPLHRAARETSTSKTVRFLIEKGADPNAKNTFGYTPLHWAAKYGHFKSLQILLSQGGDIHAKGEYDRTLLHMSVFNNKMEITKFLLQQGIDINAQTTQDDAKKTPLHDAVIHANNEMVVLLCENLRLDVNVCDGQGHACIWHAVRDNLRLITTLILYHNSFINPLNSQNPNYLNRLIEMARNKRNVEVYEELKIFEVHLKVQRYAQNYQDRKKRECSQQGGVREEEMMQKEQLEIENEILRYQKDLLKKMYQDITSLKKNPT